MFVTLRQNTRCAVWCFFVAGWWCASRNDHRERERGRRYAGVPAVWRDAHYTAYGLQKCKCLLDSSVCVCVCVVCTKCAELACNRETVSFGSRFFLPETVLWFSMVCCLVFSSRWGLHNFCSQLSGLSVTAHTGDRIPMGQDFPHPSRPVLGPTQPPIQWVQDHSRW